MQFVITILSDNPFDTISEIILSTAACGCRIADIKSSRFGDLNCAYLLVEGNWNELAKYESTLHAIEKKLHVKIHSHRIEKKRELQNSMPYTVEIVGLENTDILHKVISFLGERDVDIEEINGRHYSSPYLDTQLFSARLVISIPQSVSLFMLRDELMYTCDQINADIIFEPFRNQ
ncbi:MAG: ACT domain-containing protein [Methylococcales bacterium]|jgi:glycine cleavage system transcriptional repressor|nr:transcriptional regulator [Methylococcales bacterium]